MTGNSRSTIYSYDFKLSPFYTNSGEDIKRLLCINTFSTGIYNSAVTLLAYKPGADGNFGIPPGAHHSISNKLHLIGTSSKKWISYYKEVR